MLTRITVMKKGSQWRAKSGRKRSNEQMKRRRTAPERVDLSSVCSECCHSCIWFSRTQVTSRGVIWTGREDSAEGRRSLPEQKHCCPTSSCTVFVVFWQWNSTAIKWGLVTVTKIILTPEGMFLLYSCPEYFVTLYWSYVMDVLEVPQVICH